MELFSIVCTTCQAKLRVRDASAVGQIVTCPKCGSMVLVEPPSGDASVASEIAAVTVKPPPRPPIPSRATTSGQGATPSDSPNASHSPTSTTADPEWGISDLADTVEDPSQYGTVQVTPAQTTESPISKDTEQTGPAAANWQAAPVPEPIPGDFVDVESINKRRFMLATLAGVAGVLLAISFLAFMAARQIPTVQPIAQSDSTGNAENTVQTSSPSTAAATEQDNSAASDQAEPHVQSSAGSETVEAVEAGSPTEATPEVPTTSESLPPPTNAGLPKPSQSPPDDPAQASMPTTPAADTATATAEPAIAPPGFAAEEGDQANADRVASGGSLAETLRKLGGLFDEPPPEKPTEDPADPEATSEQATPDEATRPQPAEEQDVPSIERPPPREIDLAARLNDPIAEIRFTETPLIDFINFMSSLSTIPITLHCDDLKWLKLTPASTVTVSLRDTTTEKTLEAALHGIGLTFEAVDDQLIVKRRKLSEGLRKGKLNVSDLTNGDPQAIAELQDHVLRLVAPETWQSQGAGTLTTEGSSLVAENSEEVFLKVIDFCERLRVARGLPTRSKYNAKHFQITTRTARAAGMLGKIVKLNYVRPAPFVKIVDRLSKDLGVFLVIDWRALSDSGWNSEVEMSFTASNLTLGETLEKLLKPMDLTYRIVDESTLEITTPTALAEHQELEIYPIGKRLGATGDHAAQIQRVMSSLPAEWFRESGGLGDFRYDSPSQSLLVLLSQPKQQAIEKLIGSSAEVASNSKK